MSIYRASSRTSAEVKAEQTQVLLYIGSSGTESSAKGTGKSSGGAGFDASPILRGSFSGLT